MSWLLPGAFDIILIAKRWMGLRYAGGYINMWGSFYEMDMLSYAWKDRIMIARGFLLVFVHVFFFLFFFLMGSSPSTAYLHKQ